MLDDGIRDTKRDAGGRGVGELDEPPGRHFPGQLGDAHDHLRRERRRRSVRDPLDTASFVVVAELAVVVSRGDEHPRQRDVVHGYRQRRTKREEGLVACHEPRRGGQTCDEERALEPPRDQGRHHPDAVAERYAPLPRASQLPAGRKDREEMNAQDDMKRKKEIRTLDDADDRVSHTGRHRGPERDTGDAIVGSRQADEDAHT